MDLDDKLIIKVQLNDEIRKMPIHNEEITYDELIIMMERVFKHKLNQNDEITIKYKDEDDDLITISDDSDLVFAIESSKVLKLVLTVQNEDTDIEKNEKQLGSLDLKTIRKELQLIRDYTNKLLDKIVHLNNDSSVNANVSGRTSTTGVGDYHCVGGKEFDPLSVGNQTHFQTVERAGSSASTGSNIRQDDNSVKSNIERTKQSPSQERHFESHQIQRPSPTLTNTQNLPVSHMSPANTQSPTVTGAFNVPTSTTDGGHNFPSQNMSGSNMSQGIMSGNMGVTNLPPVQVGTMNLPPSNMVGQYGPSSNMGGQHLPPSNIGGQHLPPSSMGGQNLPPSNMGGQHLPPSNMGGQHLPPSNMGGQHLPPASMGGQNLPPSNMGGPNMPGQMPGYIGQSVQSPMNIPRPAFYAPGTQPSQSRPNMSNFNGQQVRPNMPPMGPSYFNPQTTMQQGGQMFNPQMQQPPQNSSYGYPQNK